MLNRRTSVAIAAALPLLAIAPNVRAQSSTFKWKMAIRDGGMLADMPQLFADRLKAATGGRIDTTVYAAGTLGNALRVTETVTNGIADVGFNWLAADWGKNSAGVMLGGYPGGLTDVQMLHWLYEGGGAELVRQFRDQEFGIVSFVAGMTPAEVFMHSSKPIRTLADFKGLKVRTAGAWLDMLKDLGAAPVSVAGADVYPMLERGAIDATEWSTPSINAAAGFHRIAKFVVVPGLHQPSSCWEVAFTKSTWDKLSADDKKAIETTAKLTTYESWTRIGEADARAFEVFVKNGNTIIELDDSVRKEVARVSAAWSEKQAAQNPWFKRIYDSQKAFRAAWRNAPRYRNAGD